MKDVAIIGIGMHPWGKWSDKHHLDLAVDAAEKALNDASLDWKDIPFMVACESWFFGIPGLLPGHALSERLGNRGIPVCNVSNACASGGYALKIGQALISAGLCDRVLVVGHDKSPGGFFPTLPTNDPLDLDALRFETMGLTNPSEWALVARRRMHEVGTTEVDLAQVKVKNSRHGSLNPNARYRKAFTLEEVMSSPIVCDPLRLYEICATSDGAAAIVLCSLEEARKYTTKPVIVSAVSCASRGYPDPGQYPRFPASDCTKTDLVAPLGTHLQIGIQRAYAEAGIGPEDLDFAEVYDLCTVMELLWYEQIGLCNYGDAEKLLRAGDTELGGRIPINPSGGVSSFGEAIPAQALAQVYELACQLRGDAGARQVEGAKTGLAINSGLIGNCSAIILKR